VEGTLEITFDTNCLVDLELNEGAATELRTIIEKHESGSASISVPGIGASERLKNGTFAENFSIFEQRVNMLSKRPFEILRPPFYFDIVYLDWAVWADDDMTKLERQIHEILFPNSQFILSDHATLHGIDQIKAVEQHNKEWLKWRNRKCDTLALWCHIYYQKDIFITRDNNFHKFSKKGVLEKLGAKYIAWPNKLGY
jgi:hypothetical protein